MTFLREFDSGVRLTVHAQPKASRTKIVGVHGDALKIAVQAPPVEGAANEALQDFLARVFQISKSSISLSSGASGRRKIFEIRGVSLSMAAEIIEANYDRSHNL